MKRYWYTNGNFIEEDNGEIMASDEVLPELDRLNARIAELEAALEWHPASEPPENSRIVIIELDGIDDVIYMIGHYRPLQKLWQVGSLTYVSSCVLGWHELPPMGKESR